MTMNINDRDITKVLRCGYLNIYDPKWLFKLTVGWRDTYMVDILNLLFKLTLVANDS